MTDDRGPVSAQGSPEQSQSQPETEQTPEQIDQQLRPLVLRQLQAELETAALIQSQFQDIRQLLPVRTAELEAQYQSIEKCLRLYEFALRYAWIRPKPWTIQRVPFDPETTVSMSLWPGRHLSWPWRGRSSSQ